MSTLTSTASTIAEIFPSINSTMPIDLPERSTYCLQSNPSYQPPAAQLKQLIQWFYGNKNQMNKYLKGPTGSGKTELALYFCDKLNLPVFQINVLTQTEYEHFFGTKQLTESKKDDVKGIITEDILGVVSLAYQHGGIILIDELDKLALEVQPALFPVLEGKPVFDPIQNKTITNTGNCRVICTGNTSGQGLSHAYASSTQLDAALRARLSYIELDYPTQEFELELLENEFNVIPSPIRTLLVKIAHIIRSDESIEMPLSIRSLVNICQSILCHGSKVSLVTSFKSDYLLAFDDETQIALLMSIWEREFGDWAQLSINEIAALQPSS